MGWIARESTVTTAFNRKHFLSCDGETRTQPRWRTIAAGLGDALIMLTEWQERSRQRRQLAGLSDRDLRDFGASRADAIHEAGKRFWCP
jgi:uncharacterized protein YjiS (DUF1127 family)